MTTIQFLGATDTVTGSRSLVESEGARILVVKAAHVIEIVRGELPSCCRHHPVAELGEALIA